MKAMQADRYGGPEVLREVELPDPVPGPQQLLLDVRAASVNPVDWKRISGKMRLVMPVRFPTVPGFDVAGVVAAVGPEVRFAVGDRVHARLRAPGGAFATKVVADMGVSARMPEGMSFDEAAALPLAGMTALQGLRDRLGLPMSGATERVLVVGASGGVGHLAVQLARAAGAHVVGVCSGRNAELVRSLGAHEVVDYTAADAFAGQAPFDVIYDCVGGELGQWTARLTPQGRYATAMPGVSVFLRQLWNPVCARKVRPVMLDANAADLELLDGLYAEGKLKVVVEQRFPLSALAEAWQASMAGRTRGKLVVTVG